MTGVCLVLTTCGSVTVARAMARDLVDHGLAAAATLMPVHTYYRFDGQTLDEAETQLLVVTTLKRYPEVEKHILRLHTYEVPDVFMVHTGACSTATLAWIKSSTDTFHQEPLP